ncbi:MAG: hypothetical protein KH230_16470 [Enterocloster asparagiformis]|nr:hypothetical protein [Enterocloster asparagiformis]
MVHILLMILKIIGILLLIILAVALALILAVLFVPLRYRLKASYHGTPQGFARVSWLLRIVTYRAEYGEQGFVQRLKICGICLWRSDKSREAADDAVETALSEEEQALYREMKADDEARRGGTEVGQAPDSGDNARASTGQAADGGESARTAAGQSADGGESARTAAGQSVDGGDNTRPAGEQAGKPSSPGSGASYAAKSSAPENPGAGREGINGGEDTTRGANGKDGANSRPARPAEPERPGAFSVPKPEIADAVSRPGPLARLLAKIKGVIKKLQFSFRVFCDKLKSGRETVDTVREWIGDEKNRDSVRLLLRQAKKLFKHVFPRKGHAQVTFGFDDPYTTGQALALLSPFYPLYGRVLELCPVFDQSVLFGEADIGGRIRLASLLWLAFQVYRDKHTWNLIRNFRK